MSQTGWTVYNFKTDAIDCEGVPHGFAQERAQTLGADWGICVTRSTVARYTRTDAGTGREKPLSDDDWPRN